MVYFTVQATTVYSLRESRRDWIQRKFLVYLTIQTKEKYGAALCTECAKACRTLEVEETVEACRFAKPYPSTFFAFCWQVQFSLLQFAS